MNFTDHNIIITLAHNANIADKANCEGNFDQHEIRISQHGKNRNNVSRHPIKHGLRLC